MNKLSSSFDGSMFLREKDFKTASNLDTFSLDVASANNRTEGYMPGIESQPFEHVLKR